MELSPFVFFTFILITALLAMVALKLVRAPTIPAYFLAGLFVGPNGVGILHSSESVYFAGELGIVLLLFSIGLKFSLSSLHAIRHFVFVLGTLQVALTAVVFAIPAWFFVGDVLLASLIGFVAAMSSTAVVSQLLLSNNSVASPVGRRAIGVLLLQDLVVIPLIIIYSNEGGEHSLAVTTLILIAKIVTVLFLVLRVAPNIMRGWLNWAARYGDKELFIFNIVAIISLFSMLTGVFGLSYVLGAFLAGILISETFHRHRVEQIVEPFQQLFLGFFFITLGILIEPRLLGENILIILLLTVILLVVKFFILYVCMYFVKTHRVTACRTAFLLSGGSEFGFVLLAVATDSEIISAELFQLLVPVNILAMIIVPIFWHRSEKFIRNIFPADWLRDAQRMTKNMASTQHLQDHIIICGFGRTGQAIAGVLRTVGAQSFVVLEEDHVILNAVGNAEQVIYGSSDRSESLLAAGILRAKALIVTYVEPVGATISIQNARKINPKLYIIAKALTVGQAKILSDAGADEVLVEAHETGFSLAEKTLRRLGSESVWMLPHALEGARSGKNPLFLAQYVGTRLEGEDNSSQQLVGYRVSDSSKGVRIKDIPEQVKVVALRRDGVEVDLNTEECMLLPYDQLILLGEDEYLEQTKKLLNE